jgi:hypothetical protein
MCLDPLGVEGSGQITDVPASKKGENL